jgi:hypothetical protein
MEHTGWNIMKKRRLKNSAFSVLFYQINLATSFPELIACHPLAGSLESPIVKISPLKSEFESSV